MNVNKAGKADVSARRAALIRLRRKRTPYDSPEILGLGYETAADARKDFYRAVTARRKATEAEVADYREEQNAIFESILDSFIPLALGDDENGPDHKAADVVLKTLERQAKVNGWEEALKAELSGPGGGPVRVRAETIAELRNLIRTAGEPDDEDLDDDSDEETTDDDGT
ncbi:hypothetical protein D3C59_30115 [Streptomyces sp. SHP22-7]|nr:hypothetical protein D3C59_35375 [Streptomyces sp. SHP22-7]RIH58750.1 hypothetical protein D3C59_32940 [Streptomyces sp. SHP22-7]RIH59118.1 hypothetical protein D3C59_30115 [Streptomyces sp. SHP22-7]